MIQFAPLTRIIKHLIIINVLVFVAVYFLPLANFFGLTNAELAKTLSFHFPKFESFEPFQIITHMFMHADLRHILYNMVGLYFLGTTVENALGEKRFLTLYFVAGFVALIAHYIIGYNPVRDVSLLGASGAVSGVVVAFATLYPNRKLMIIPIPVPVKAVYLVGAYLAYDLYSGFYGGNTGIAHFAHLGGALAGFILATYWKKENYRKY